MKKEEISKLIDSIHINSANLEYIASTGKINGTLRSELERIIQSLTEPSSKRLDHICRSIVNGLYELAELDVKKRQDLNDRADEYVLGILESLTQEPSAVSIAERLVEIELQATKKAKAQFYPNDNTTNFYKVVFEQGARWAMQEYAQSNTEAMRELELSDNITFKFKDEHNTAEITLSIDDVWDKIQDYVYEKLEDGASNCSCLNESTNHCECSPIFEAYELDKIIHNEYLNNLTTK